MWTLYLLSHIWLTGSLLLPLMLLLRWGGTKWRGLHWLTRTKKLWLMIWGGYGFVKVIAVAALLWVRYFPEFVPFDFLGWSGVAVWSAVYALHIHSEHLSIELLFLIGLSLQAIVETAIDCGLAALVWSVYSWLTQEEGTHRRMLAIERYGICLLLSACALGIVNNLHFWRPATCYDCHRPDGVPFTFFQEGGFIGDAGFVWSGVIGDSLVMLVLGFVLGLVWNKLVHRHSNLRTSTS
jgi:hypothetical protein